jgi:hypothetical protein
MHKKHLNALLENLKPPLGILGVENDYDVASKLVKLELREDENNCIYFNDLFYELMKAGYRVAFKDKMN